MLPDREVAILTDPPMLGVVACLPPHVLSAEEREKAPGIKDLFVDTGLSQEKAGRRIPMVHPWYTAPISPLWESASGAPKRWMTGPALPPCCGLRNCFWIGNWTLIYIS